MKRIFMSIILSCLTLTCCSHVASLSVITPTGAPALAFYDYASNNDFETNSNPNNIVAIMASGQKDVAVLPTNAGMQTIINKAAPYQIAATISFGNFYIASLNNDADNIMDANDTIVLFQKNNVPDKIFHYLYGNELDSAIHYVNALSDAASALLTGSFISEDGNNLVPNYVMVAEPVLSTVLNKKENVTIFKNIQEEYKQKSNGQEMFQASVFIKNEIAKDVASSFLNKLESDIKNAIENPDLMKNGMNKIDNAQQVFGINADMAETVLKNGNRMGLGFKLARDNKNAIENFLTIFGINNVDEKIYF